MAQNVQTLQNQLLWARKQKSFAWAKYYSSINDRLVAHHAQVVVLQQSTGDDVAIPVHIKTQLKEMATTLRKEFECPICMDMIKAEDLAITNCGHYYCKGCLGQHKEHQQSLGKPKWECAVCKRKHGYGSEE